MITAVSNDVAGVHRAAHFANRVYLDPPIACDQRYSGDACLMNTPSTVIHAVDDDATFRAAISRLLKTSNYQVVVRPSAKDFFETPLRVCPERSYEIA